MCLFSTQYSKNLVDKHSLCKRTILSSGVQEILGLFKTCFPTFQRVTVLGTLRQHHGNGNVVDLVVGGGWERRESRGHPCFSYLQ